MLYSHYSCSHGRGARGAAVGLNSSRLVVTQVARTGNTIRLPMPAPAPHPSPRAAPHPTLLCLFNPDSTRSYQSTLSYRSSNVVHLNSPPMSFRAASRSLSDAPSSSKGGPSNSKAASRSSMDAPSSPMKAPSNSKDAPSSSRDVTSSSSAAPCSSREAPSTSSKAALELPGCR